MIPQPSLFYLNESSYSLPENLSIENDSDKTMVLNSNLSENS
jgi:hypothetical protein